MTMNKTFWESPDDFGHLGLFIYYEQWWPMTFTLPCIPGQQVSKLQKSCEQDYQSVELSFQVRS
jgi:hypothetical protein